MTAFRNNLTLLICLAALLSLTACTREITTVEQVDPGASNCFSCHSDQESFLYQPQTEWANSAHGIGAYVGYAGNRSGCYMCHSGSGFVAYQNDDEGVPYGQPIGCFACHSPHSDGDFGLRLTEAQVLETGDAVDLGRSNMCTFCHKARREVYSYVDSSTDAATDSTTVTSSHWGPHHGPQTDLFLGVNGFEFEGYTFDNATPTAHLNSEEYGRCVGCHFAETGDPALGGHTFSMHYNDGDDNYNVNGCNECHTDLADFDYNDVQTDVEALAATLHALLEAEGLVDAEGHPVEDAVSTRDKVGALWNYMFYEEDRSHGVHNPDYVKSLLEASIDVMGGGV